MVDSGVSKMHSLLFEEDRVLENIKFFPGSDRGLTSSQLSAEAEAMIRGALNSGPKDMPPLTGRQKTSIRAGN